MGSQTSRKTGVRSTSEKVDSTRHPFNTAPSAKETEGSQSYRARTLNEYRIGRVRVPEPKVWSTRKRNRRLDGSGHFDEHQL